MAGGWFLLGLQRQGRRYDGAAGDRTGRTDNAPRGPRRPRTPAGQPGDRASPTTRRGPWGLHGDWALAMGHAANGKRCHRFVLDRRKLA